MKVNSLLYTLVLGAAAVGFSHPAVAAEEEHHHKALTDALFAKKAAGGGLTEVDLGKIAAQNGDSQDVKDFGSKMVTDHGKANDQLKAIASKDSLTIPDKPNDDQQAMIDRISKKTGKAFDAAYIHAMVHAHLMDKALFTQESEDAKNPDLKQFASDTLQVIDQHLSMIEDIANAHGITTTSAHHKKMDMAGSSATPVAPASGDAAMSKGGTGPGANANPVPDSTTSTGAAEGSAAPNGPTTGDAAMSKGGPAPGGNANPAPGSGQ